MSSAHVWQGVGFRGGGLAGRALSRRAQLPQEGTPVGLGGACRVGVAPVGLGSSSLGGKEPGGNSWTVGKFQEFPRGV